MRFIIKTLHGLEDVLLLQLKELGAQNCIKLTRAVECEGNLEFLYKAALSVPTALRILLPIEEAIVHTEKDLYRKAKKIEWEKVFDINQNFAIDCVSFASFHTHSKFLGLRVKDAIVDRFRDLYGERPNVETKDPDYRINVHISDKKVSFSLDCIGFSLNQRAYREMGHVSPLNEVLAAGILQLSEWKADRDFLDPMCGSGTLAIEAAMLAANMPCNWNVKHFAFMNWKNFDKKKWREIRDEFESEFKIPNIKIYANDKDNVAVEIAKQSSRNAGVFKYISFSNKDFMKLDIPLQNGVIVTNPPYGERLEIEDAIAFYKEIGDTLKTNFSNNNSAFILSGNIEAGKRVGLKPSRKIPLFNGKIECRLFKFDLYSGSKNKNKEQN
jgi:putative N6-adenine-specific DNA methylase